MKVLMLSQADVTALLDLDRLLDALEDGFRAVSSGKVEVPGRTAVTAEHDGWLGTMPGYGAGLGLGVKLVSVFPHNDAAGLPSHQALIALFDPATGSPLAVMDGTRITAIRTAGAGAFSPPPAGCMELAGMDPEKASEMGEVLLGKRPERRSDDEITVYKSMGHAVEDLAAASLVYTEAQARGAGSTVEL